MRYITVNIKGKVRSMTVETYESLKNIWEKKGLIEGHDFFRYS